MKIEINRQKDEGKPKGAIDEASLLSAKSLDDILGILGRKKPTPVKEGGQNGDDACNGENECHEIGCHRGVGLAEVL